MMQIVWKNDRVIAVLDDSRDVTGKYLGAIVLHTSAPPTFIPEEINGRIFHPGQLAAEQLPDFIADTGLVWNGNKWTMPESVQYKNEARPLRTKRAANRLKEVLTIDAIRGLKTEQDSIDLAATLISKPTELEELPAFVDEVRLMFGRLLHVAVNNGRLSLQNDDAIRPDDE